jgi:hypothetical protein
VHRIVGLWVAGAFIVAGCSSSEILIAHNVALTTATEVVPEAELLDVGVVVFDSGVPEGEVDKDVLEELIREGTFVQIRRAESLYMATVLRDTLQKSGNWGAVWVTPKDTTAADLTVTAKILHSDGDLLRLHATATDATGRVWLDDNYEMSTAAGAFNRQRYPDLDPYQDVFNEIANDLAAARERLNTSERREVRTVAGLRYAADLSPESFTGYVVPDKSGRYEVNRLPASNDPMYDRTQRVRQRERLFLDTLDQHYEEFSRDATKPYDSWREYAREEAIEIRELTQSTRWRMGMGVATILASIVYSSNSNGSFTDRVIRDAMMYIGTDMIRTSQVRKQEKKIHTDTLEELSTSFDDQVKPMIVDVQGTEHRLTGTADAQYQEWRDLLKQIFINETGFVPEDVVFSTEEPAVEAPVELPPLPVTDEAAPASETPPETGGEATPEAVSDANASASGGA